MKNCLYSIKDELSEFAAPIMLKDDNVAKRYFHLQLENTPLLKDNPTDFSIWCVGEVDTNTGIVTGYNVPQLIERGYIHGESKETV